MFDKNNLWQPVSIITKDRLKVKKKWIYQFVLLLFAFNRSVISEA